MEGNDFMTQVRWMAVLAIIVLIATGCTNGNEKGVPQYKGGEHANLKVLAWNSDTFESIYGQKFGSKYPNIDVEVVSASTVAGQGGEVFLQFIKEQKPDVLILSEEQYRQLASKQMLINLQDLAKSTNYDMKSYNDAVLDLLKEKGEGTLYGLTPTYAQNAIFYNKDLFDKYHIEYPKDHMTWKEILELAERFPTEGSGESRIYGLSFPGNIMAQNEADNLNILIQMMGMTEGLNILQDTTMKMTIDSDLRKGVAEQALQAYRSGAIHFTNLNQLYSVDILKDELFPVGRSAMYLGSYIDLKGLRSARENLNVNPFNWDIVTEPVDPRRPNQSSSISLLQIMSINAASSNVGAAWEMLKYFNGDEYAKLMSKANTQLLSRSGYQETFEDHNMDAFHQLQLPDIKKLDYGKLPPGFWNQYDGIVSQQLEDVLNNNKSVDDAFKSLQEQGQQALDAAILQGDADKKQ